MQILQTEGGDRTEHTLNIPSFVPFEVFLSVQGPSSISKRSSKLSTDSIDQLGRNRVQKTTPVPPSELSPQPLELD